MYFMYLLVQLREVNLLNYLQLYKSFSLQNLLMYEINVL